jgi:transposase
MTKSKISKFFVGYLTISKTGRNLSVPLWKIVKAILYKLKTGVQWKHLPMRQFFGFSRYSWQSVYYHFNKWSQSGVWLQCYKNLIKDYRRKLDMSLINLDGTHTPAKRGGEAVGYQGRKKTKTSNMLILTDRQGVPIGWSLPISGEHHDSYNLRKNASDIFKQLESMGLNLDGLFLNADAGFDVNDFRELCESKNIFHNIDFNKRRSKSNSNESYLLDNELYKERFSVEQLNAWVDGFKTLRVRYETRSSNWMALHCLAFAIIFIRKFDNLTFSF